jgi:hypothetical protein
MDIRAEGLLNIADWRTWMLQPDAAFQSTLENLFRSVRWNAPEEARRAIDEHYRMIVEVRKRSKSKSLDNAREQERVLFTLSYEELVARLASLQHGGVRNAKLRRRLSPLEATALARAARQPRIVRIAARLAEMSKGHGSQWVQEVPRWKELTALRPPEREIVSKLLPFILGFKIADRQASKIASFIAQFLCGLAIDINASISIGRGMKTPKSWYSPDYAAKVARGGAGKTSGR